MYGRESSQRASYFNPDDLRGSQKDNFVVRWSIFFFTIAEFLGLYAGILQSTVFGTLMLCTFRLSMLAKKFRVSTLFAVWLLSVWTLKNGQINRGVVAVD